MIKAVEAFDHEQGACPSPREMSSDARHSPQHPWGLARSAPAVATRPAGQVIGK